jgi:hypothetical protein
VVAYVLPTLALLVLVCLPMILGERTLYLRDTFGTHLPMKSFQASSETLLPLVDPHRAGGQAHLANPNTVPLYPDNALYRVAGLFWAFNAHFWIHWLLAPLSFFWLARCFNLSREAAWMGGVAFAASGYFLSNMNLYNLVAAAALAPALVAACLTLAGGARRALGTVGVAGLWALLILSGDPMTAGMGLLLALAAVGLEHGRAWSRWRPLTLALGLGTLISLPQLVEFARLLPHTYRGFWGYSPEGVTLASWPPRAAIEWLLPLFHGWPDLGYWGQEVHGGELPLFFSLAPGALAMVLALASGRPSSRAARWAWGAVAFGVFMALGKHNPLLMAVLRITEVGLIRLPVKFWLMVAAGGSLLVALGFERLLSAERRSVGRLLLATTVLYLALWLALSFGASGWARGVIPAAFSDGFVQSELQRWAGVALVTLVVLAASLGLLRLARRHPALLALLPILHLASQLFFLKPLLPTDEVAFHSQPPPLLEAVPGDARLVHGDMHGLFGSVPLDVSRYPDRSLAWFQRQTHEQLYPYVGMRFGRHYELNHSPEGLDAFLSRATAQAFKVLPDPARVRLLAASGVDLLLISRRLTELEASGELHLERTEATSGGDLYVYRVTGRAERARLVGSVVRSPHLNGTLSALTSPDFDLQTTTVLPGAAGSSQGPPGTVRWIESSAGRLELEVESSAGGVLVVQRTPLPGFRALVDGEKASIQPADLHRIGVVVDAGRHRVVIWADRTPVRIAMAISALGLLATLGLAWSGRSRRTGVRRAG